MKKYLPYIIIILVAGGLIYFGFFKEERTPSTNNQQTVQSTDSAKETKTDEQASVTVAVTPLDLSALSAEWKFNITMDTHSVELDQDLVAISTLVDDRGNKFKPIRWDGPVGGHHREGVLVFKSIGLVPVSVELKIEDVGGVDRSFIWQFK